MNMWDDLMNTFNFPSEKTEEADNRGMLCASSISCSPTQSSIPSSSSSAGLFFPSVGASTAANAANSAIMDRKKREGDINRHQLGRSTSHTDLKEDLPADVESVSVPYLRPRLYTWGSAVPSQSDSQSSNLWESSERIAAAPALPRLIGANKRRATCPDSMRNYRRGIANHGGATAATFSRKQERCPDIVHVESEVNDDYNDLDFFSSANASSASDLSLGLGNRLGKMELMILRQPESHHRARYQKEGSRGCIKDRTGNSCPAVQLTNFNGSPVTLQAFIATEFGPIRPHPLYRVCKVGGKHSTPCRERTLDNGLTALEMDLTGEHDYILNVDCLGIMKLRNADFEQVLDAEDLAKRKKPSPKVRLVFRAIFGKTSDDRMATLQVVSTPICCTPSPGVPEIHFISHSSCLASGGIDMVVIGRNFVKDDSRLFVVEKNEEDTVLWEGEVTLLQENFNQVHLVGTLPAYKDTVIRCPVELNLYVRNKGGKQSEPHRFTYLPDDSLLQNAPSTPTSPSTENNAFLRETVPSSTTDSDTKNGSTSSVIPIIQIPAQYAQTASLNGQNLQYCIQLPGSLQPIIITIPQAGPASPSVSNGFDSFPALQQQIKSLQTLSQDRPQNPLQNSYASDLGGLLLGSTISPSGTSITLPSSDHSSSKSLGAEDRTCTAHPLASDEDLFNELLQEILGTTDQANVFCEGNNGGNFMNFYQSPDRSPSSLAALAAAQSFSAMDINGPMHTNVANFLLEEEQDDLMG